MRRLASLLFLLLAVSLPTAASAQLGALQSAITYAATAPVIDSVSVAGSSPGSTPIITGRNFVNVQQVLFANVPATSFQVQSRTSIHATVPQLNVTAYTNISIVVVTAAGRTAYAGQFAYIPTTTTTTVTRPPTSGVLSVALGFGAVTTAPHQCQGEGKISIVPVSLSGTGGIAQSQSQNYRFSGLSENTPPSCRTNVMFLNLRPGTWNITEMGGIACNDTVSAGQITTVNIRLDDFLRPCQ
jgi:hypothetical protein